jgi:hypothetical protein
MKALLFSAAIAIAGSGCASRIQVDYLSDPPGATLYEEGRPIGVTPVSLYYAPDASFKNGSCQRAKGTSVVWASGVRAEISFLELCPNVGWTQHYWFRRPDVPGRDVDMNFALQMQRNGIMQQQAAAQALSNMRPPLTPYQLPAPPRMGPALSCTSYNSAGQVITNCQ